MSINHRSIDQARWSIDDWLIKTLIDQGMLIDRADRWLSLVQVTRSLRRRWHIVPIEPLVGYSLLEEGIMSLSFF